MWNDAPTDVPEGVFNFPPTVPTKEDYYRRWMRLEFGNRPAAWDSVPEALASDWRHPFVLRYADPDGGGSGHTKFWIPPDRLEAEAAAMVAAGADPSRLRVTVHEPGVEYRFHGETARRPGVPGFCLQYSRVPEPFRPAMAKGARHAKGLEAVGIVKDAMDAESWDWFGVLLERYPDAAIEFTVYDRACGVLKLNTVIWEVRSF